MNKRTLVRLFIYISALQPGFVWAQGVAAGTKPDECYRTGCNGDGEMCESGASMIARGGGGGFCEYSPDMYCVKYSECGHFGSTAKGLKPDCAWKETETYKACLDGVQATQCLHDSTKCDKSK